MKRNNLQMSYARTEYIPGAPSVKISKFKIGKDEGDYKMLLVSREDGFIKQESLESARVMANKLLESTLGIGKYTLEVMIYPHLVMREHKQLGVAGADRLSDGMRRAFGKPVTRLAKVNKGQVILKVSSNKGNEKTLKAALEAARYKLPVSTTVRGEAGPKVENQ
jgi:large subunit ribosomal protein L10e